MLSIKYKRNWLKIENTYIWKLHIFIFVCIYVHGHGQRNIRVVTFVTVKMLQGIITLCICYLMKLWWLNHHILLCFKHHNLILTCKKWKVNAFILCWFVLVYMCVCKYTHSNLSGEGNKRKDNKISWWLFYNGLIFYRCRCFCLISVCEKIKY